GSGERPGAEGSAATSMEASEIALDMVLLSAIELPCPRPWGLGSRALFEWLIFPDASAARLRTTDNGPDRSGPRRAARPAAIAIPIAVAPVAVAPAVPLGAGTARRPARRGL